MKKSEVTSSKRKKHHGDDLEESSDENEEGPEEPELFATKPRGERPDEGKDRGPFGSGPAVDFDDEEVSDEDGQVFREGSATSAKSSQLRLLRYAQRYPGRLASRMLQKMEKAVARGVVELNEDMSKRRTPVVAVNHMQTVLIPGLGQKAGIRSTRELKTLGTILDHLAAGKASMAADVVTQRIKALERATMEGHWSAAQFLELLPPEGSSLLDRDEEVYLAREYLLDQRLKKYDRGWERRDQGGAKGKGKDGKGKTKERTKSGGGAWDKNPSNPPKSDTK